MLILKHKCCKSVSKCSNNTFYLTVTALTFRFTGIIKLRRSPPPRLRGPQYVLNITATDDNASGGPYPLSNSAQVIVGINDINNNKPVFEEVTELILPYWKIKVFILFTASSPY